MKHILDALLCWEKGDYTGLFDLMRILSQKLDTVIDNLQMDVTRDVFSNQTIFMENEFDSVELQDLFIALKIVMYCNPASESDEELAVLASANNNGDVSTNSQSIFPVDMKGPLASEQNDDGNVDYFNKVLLGDSQNVCGLVYHDNQTLLNMLENTITANLTRRKHAFWHTLKNFYQAEHHVHWSNAKPALLHPIMASKNGKEKWPAIKKLAERLTSLCFKAEAIILLNKAKRSASKFKEIDLKMLKLFENSSHNKEQFRKLTEIWKAKTNAEEVTSFFILNSKKLYYESNRWSCFASHMNSYISTSRCSGRINLETKPTGKKEDSKWLVNITENPTKNSVIHDTFDKQSASLKKMNFQNCNLSKQLHSKPIMSRSQPLSQNRTKEDIFPLCSVLNRRLQRNEKDKEIRMQTGSWRFFPEV
ncbi:Hypothetical predicted protein [Octopus vulgaris]|uniref:Uncharacterized protein n=1 Tax=Octopus vulgaris TaxID=6645 RepID=A0AA36ARI6_OCTVU|nr:Hypothetical predicted protein [Octopus vulgaris]